MLEQRRSRQTYRQIAQRVPVAQSTIARLLRRAGVHRLADLEPAVTKSRYEYAQPRQLLHLDIKKLARFRQPGHRITGNRRINSDGIGWEYVHLAIDDHSRVAFGSIEPNERGISACNALMRAVRYYRSLDVRFERVLTGNGACYKSRCFRASYAGWACATYGHDPTHRAATARPNDWSRPACAHGPTPGPTKAPSSAPRPCRGGCITATGTGPPQASAINPRSSESH